MNRWALRDAVAQAPSEPAAAPAGIAGKAPQTAEDREALVEKLLDEKTMSANFEHAPWHDFFAFLQERLEVDVVFDDRFLDGIGLAKSPFLRLQHSPGAAGNESPDGLLQPPAAVQRAMMQSPPAAFRSSQRRVASAPENGPTRTR